MVSEATVSTKKKIRDSPFFLRIVFFRIFVFRFAKVHLTENGSEFFFRIFVFRFAKVHLTENAAEFLIFSGKTMF